MSPWGQQRKPHVPTATARFSGGFAARSDRSNVSSLKLNSVLPPVTILELSLPWDRAARLLQRKQPHPGLGKGRRAGQGLQGHPGAASLKFLVQTTLLAFLPCLFLRYHTIAPGEHPPALGKVTTVCFSLPEDLLPLPGILHGADAAEHDD